MFKFFFPFKIGILNIFFVNCIFLMILSGIFAIFSIDNAISCLLGGCVSLSSSFLFFFIFFFNNKDYSHTFIVRKFYIAGFIKFFSFILFCFCSFLIGVNNIFLFLLFLFLFHIIVWSWASFFLKGM